MQRIVLIIFLRAHKNIRWMNRPRFCGGEFGAQLIRGSAKRVATRSRECQCIGSLFRGPIIYRSYPVPSPISQKIASNQAGHHRGSGVRLTHCKPRSTITSPSSVICRPGCLRVLRLERSMHVVEDDRTCL